MMNDQCFSSRLIRWYVLMGLLCCVVTVHGQLTHEQIFDDYVATNKTYLVAAMDSFEYDMPLPPGGVSITTMAMFPVEIVFPKAFCEIYRVELHLYFADDLLDRGEGWKIDAFGQKMNTYAPDISHDSKVSNPSENCLFKDGRFTSTITALHGSFQLQALKFVVYGIPVNPMCGG